jgi:hypothetical protein
MTSLRLTVTRLGQVAAMATTALTLWACSEQASLTSPPRPLTPEATRPAFNVVPTTAATAVLCTVGPAGTYNYTVSLNIPQTVVINGSTVDYGAANIALVQTAAFETITVGNVSNTAGTCLTIGTILKSLNFPSAGGVISDPERFLTITQTSGPAGTQLDQIVTTVAGDPDVTTTPPPPTATINFNFFHGAVASFFNSQTPPPPAVCDFITFGRLVTTVGDDKIVISGNAGGNAPGGGILGTIEISVGGTQYLVQTIESYGPTTSGVLFPDPFARVITGHSGTHLIELRLRDDPNPGQGEPGTAEGDKVWLKIDNTVVVPLQTLDQGNIQLHLNCRGPGD